MILGINGIIATSRGIIVSDADAQAFINAAIITDITQANAINSLVISLKSANIWTKMKAIYPFVGGTAEQHRFNLKDPRAVNEAFYLTFYGGGTHGPNGYQPNGNSYADTKLVPSVMAQNSVHTSIYSRTDIDGLYFDIYGENSTSGLGMLIKYNGAKFLYMNVLSSDNVINNTTSAGFYIGTRTGSTTSALFRNNTKIINGTRASLTPDSTQPLYLGAANYSGTAGGYSPRQQAFASIGDGLTDTESANFYTAVQTFQTTLGRQVGVPIVADTDAQAFLNAAVITDTTQASAVNQLVLDLKSANVWTKMKAIYPFVGGTATTHKFNLKDPRDLDAAYRLVFNGGWTHSSTGALPNGTNAYANTFLKPNAMGQNNAHVSFYSRTDVSRSSPDISAWAGGSTGGINLYPRTSSNNTFYYLNDNNNLKYVSSSSSIGFFNASRTTGTNVAMFKNGVKIDNGAGSSTVPSAYNIYLSAENNVGVVGSYSNRESAFASIGDGLSDTEAANFYTAVQTFQTTLGRQV